MFMEYKECELQWISFWRKWERSILIKVNIHRRLDPMACGIVPLIQKDEFKNIGNHLKTNKTYRTRVILGLKTDSDDVLGMIEDRCLIINNWRR